MLRLLNLIPILGLAAVVMAGSRQEDTAPKVALSLSSKIAKPGGELKGTVDITFEEGLHGYQNPPSTKYQIPVAITCGTKGVTAKFNYPKGVVRKVGGEEAAVYEGTVKIPVTFKIPKKTGKLELKVSVAYQQCTETVCFPPGKAEAKASVDVKATKGKSQ